MLKEARTRGTKILTWDSDGDVEARDFTVVHATPEAIGHALSFEVGRVLRGHGSFAAITSTLSAPNQKVWLAEFKTRTAKDYPDIRLLDVVPCDDRSENARNETLRLLEKHVCRFRPSVMLTSKMESSTASSSGRRATSGILLA